MVTSSATKIPLCLHSTTLNNHNPKLVHHPISYNPLKTLLLYSPKTLSTLYPKLQATSKPQDSPVLTCSWKPQKEIPKFFSEKIVILLVGSFLFMGLRAKNAVSVSRPVQESSVFETQEDNSEEEEEMYVKLLEKNERDVEALKTIVNVKMRKGKTKEALKYVEKLIEVQPREMEWRLLQALCYEMTGQLSKAKSLFKEILKQRPLLLRALHGLAMVMHKNFEGPAVFEMLSDALEVARREKRVNEERNIKILVAQMHVVKGELEEALQKFQHLVKENPRDFRPYLCQGIVYSLLDKKKEANEQFEIYRSLVPEEFPQRGFLDDVVLAAKTETREQLEKEFKTQFSYKT
ncbi:protein SLOW GREEN 1, chloroplastic [Nicotiana tabacum]|uniref:Protein SLOW GREEN 1, chloroplastic n=1 Tax=Nicotiana tabacum TaxID=4097 RepID=A0A1S4AWZ0_TOBAC|nr:PREDICTED: protein SLOW GREEN 1, chloroplastic-like [Nicotiana tabacum]